MLNLFSEGKGPARPMNPPATGREGGMGIPELMISLVIGALLLSGLFHVWNVNQKESNRIQNKAESRGQLTLAANRLQKSLTLAGFGMDRITTIFKGEGTPSDTLIVYSNEPENRTTLTDTTQVGDTLFLVANARGFKVGCWLGITDGGRQEYLKVRDLDSTTEGANYLAVEPSRYGYIAGSPDIYPVKREKFYTDARSLALVRIVDNTPEEVARGISDLQIEFKTRQGASTQDARLMKMMSFSFKGSYDSSATAAMNKVTFSSTVIPRNNI